MNMTLLDLFHEKALMPFPTIVCLFSSTRFFQAYRDANLRETLNGKIVLTIDCDAKANHDLQLGPIDKTRLDIVHHFKIELSDEVLILNVSGYVGESTCREIEYARMLGKTLRWLEPEVRA